MGKCFYRWRVGLGGGRTPRGGPRAGAPRGPKTVEGARGGGELKPRVELRRWGRRGRGGGA